MKRDWSGSFLSVGGVCLLALLGCAGPVLDEPEAEPKPPAAGSWAGDLFFVSNQDGWDPAAGRYPGAFEEQVKQTLENLGIVLSQAGLDLSDVVKVNAYLTASEQFQPMNQVYRTYFPDRPPARTTVMVPALPEGAHVSVTAIASRNPDRSSIYPEGQEPSPDDVFTPAVLVGDLLFLSGQGSRHYLTREFPEGEFEDHVRQTLDNLGAVLKAAGMDFSNVVKSNVYLTDFGLFQRMNQAYVSYFPENPPARTTVGVKALPGDPPIEITFIAARKGKEVVTPEGVEPRPLFSTAVRFQHLLFPSGKAGTAEGGVPGQTREIMDALGEVLEAAGLGYEAVVEGKVYLTDPTHTAEMRHVYDSYFGGSVPALTVVGVAALPGDRAEVEITLAAAGGTGDPPQGP